MMITFHPITRDNYRSALNMKVAPGQEAFVADNTYTLAQCYVWYPEFIPLLIYDDDTPVGFLMHAFEQTTGYYWIVRFMIAAEHQRKGYGRAALRAAIHLLRQQPNCHEIRLSYEPTNQHARALYLSTGFVETGEIDDGEVVAALKVTR